MLKYLLIFPLFLLNNTCFSSNLTNFNHFLGILARVESSNNPKAYNKSENAIGIYQIRLNYFIDATKYDKNLAKYEHSDCFNPEISKLVVKAYFGKYSKTNDFEEWARLHNGGPNWKNKTGKSKENLNRYWENFQKKSLTNK